MEWSKAQLAKRSPPGSEVIIGKMTNNSQTSALIILIMFTTCVSSQFHVWPRAELSRESNLQWIHNLQKADCAVESHYTVYIVHNCTCNRATLYCKLCSGARVLHVVLRSPDPDLIQWRLNRAKQLRPLGHQTPQCCSATRTSSTIWSVLLCECANRCNVLKPTMADLINVRSRARALW